MRTVLFILYCIYILKQDIRIYKYMLHIAGHTARPIGLKFFVISQDWHEAVIG